MVIQRAAAAFDDDERWRSEAGGEWMLPVQLADRAGASEGPGGSVFPPNNT